MCMKFCFRSLFCLVVIFYFSASASVANEYSYDYVIEVKKIKIGKLFWNIFLNEDEYKISVLLEDRGILSAIYKFEGRYESRGKIINDYLEPESYNQFWKTKKKQRRVGIFFKNNSLVELNLYPEEKEWPRVEYLGLKNHLDPLSSFLNILLGNKNSKVVDGRRIYSMVGQNTEEVVTGLSKKIQI